MWGVVWLGWMVAAGLTLTLHHVPWWIYLVTFAAVVLATYIGWAALDAAGGMGVVSVTGMIAAAALLYFHHVPWWVYVVVGSACWIGVSIGYVAATEHPEVVKRHGNPASEPQGGTD